MFGIKNFLNPLIKNKMKDVKLSAILGREVMAGEQLSAEDMQKIVAAIPEPNPNAEETQNAETINQDELVNQITASVTSAVETSMNQRFDDLNARLEKVENSAGAPATVTTPNNGEHKKEEESYSTKMAKQMLNAQ